MLTTLKNFERFFGFVSILLIFSFVSFSLPIYAQAKSTSIVPSSVTIQRTLKLTMPRIKGDDVKALQTFLNTLGYNTGTPDGSFGPKTEKAVKLFQIAKHLTPDGKAGKITLSIISKTLSTQTTGTSPNDLVPSVSRPTGCASGALYSITTGLSCSTGLPPTPVFKMIGGGSSGPSIHIVSPTIKGVTIPAQAQTPTGTLSDTTQYSATISWTGSPSVFLASTSYTAIITLTPKSNYTLTGIPANYFTIAGATTTNAKDSGVITAVFPATPLKQLTISTPTITTSKVYDGTTTAVVSAGTISGIIGAEDVAVSATATYDTKQVGTGKTITVIYTLGGANASNYIKPADYTVTTGIITPIQLTITNPNLTTSKEYDRTTSATVVAGSLIGVVDGGVTVSAVANYDTLARGEAKMITVVYSLSGVNAGNYIKPIDRIEYTGIITQKQLTISTPDLTLSKPYDGNTIALVTAGSLTGVALGEDVTVSSAIATYDNPSSGSGKTITVVYTISGASIANYKKPVDYITTSGSIGVTIQLTISTPTITTSKVYDGNNSADVTAGTLSGVLSGDIVTVTASATYDDSSVGSGKIITVVYTLGGADKDNYTKPVNDTSSSGIITPITINNSTISGVTAPSIGATPVTTTTETAQYTGTVSWSGNPVTFASDTSYTATVTLTPKTGYTLTGVTTNFFSVSGANTTNSASSGIITALFPATPLIQLSISNPTITLSKVYDGNTTAVATAGTLSGVVGADDVTIHTTIATYDNKFAGSGKTITVVYTLTGADKDKYIKPADYTVSNGIITAIQLTISNPVLTTSKEYDRNTSASVTAGTLSGVVDGGVTVTALANYDTPSVNTGKTITVSYTLSGANAGNYVKPVDRIEYTGVISQKQLTISSPTLTTTKLYDRNTNAVVTIGSLSGVIGSEDVSVSGVATYDTANAGTGKTITIVYTITGASIANYIKPVNYTTSSGVINAIQLTIPTPTLTTTKVYDAGTSAVVTPGALSGILSPDTVTVSALANYDTSLPGTSKTITVVYTLAGAQAGNYTKPVDYLTSTGIITAIVINTPAISGVTAPATDATPVSSLADGTGYTATISWSPSGAIFLNTTVYTATITLTPKTGYTLTGVGTNFFTVSGATATNTANTGVVTAVFPITQAYATVPSSIVLAVGSTAPVGGVTNVAIPVAGGTDTTGVITGYVATSADKIKFTVTDNGGTSTITINGSAYTSGTDYQIVPTTSFPTVVVTTTQTNRTTTTRTFVITGPFVNTDGLTYGIAIGADGKKWLDRNLGAKRVATTYSDTQSYGYLYQWGRANDGHQKNINSYTNGVADSNSATSSTLSATDTVSAPDTAKFIMSPSSPYDWRSPQSPNASTLWAGANGGTNNVCPAGFHVPTPAEWQTWVTALGGFTTATCGGTSTCRETAFNSSLKIPVAGYRSYSDGSLYDQGSGGFYWSSSVSGTNASYLYFYAAGVTPANAGTRASGLTVRCLTN